MTAKDAFQTKTQAPNKVHALAPKHEVTNSEERQQNLCNRDKTIYFFLVSFLESVEPF